MKCETYGFIHKNAKKILGRATSPAFRMVSVGDDDIDVHGYLKAIDKSANFINEMQSVDYKDGIKKSQLYPVENIVPLNTFSLLHDSFDSIKKGCASNLGVSINNAETKWLSFIHNSVIPDGYRNAGLHYAGFIMDANEWCLPSWIWTNAALARMYCTVGEIETARKIVDLLIDHQQECGGWIVRNDYDAEGAVPVLAPNDSAYLANNGCLELYKHTNEEKYLNAAIRCADWIIKTARDDGMVLVGYDMRRMYWQTKHNIVDVGFTAGLFSRLYECTGAEQYLIFLKKFTRKYVELFYIREKHGFATSLDAEDRRFGGMFGRGQAWALEGLIPASDVLHDHDICNVVKDTIEMLVEKQDKDGGWAYNISRALMGVDCKATPIIACCMMEWYRRGNKDKRILDAAEKALSWCLKHTANSDKGEGGIYSYTVEGAIVHHMYTWTAFVYSSAYAIELKRALSRENLL